MLLSDQEIKKLAKEDGIITPFEERNLQSVSYDITAGNIARVFNRLSDPIDLNDKEASAYFGLAQANEKMGCTEIALTNYERAVSLAPGNREYNVALRDFKSK